MITFQKQFFRSQSLVFEKGLKVMEATDGRYYAILQKISQKINL